MTATHLPAGWGAPRSAPPRRVNLSLTQGMNTATRWATITVFILLTLMALNTLVSAFTPAAALKITEICDQQFNFTAPVESKGFLGSSGYNSTGVHVTPGDANYVGVGNLTQPYGTSGLFWQVSGNTFCDATAINPVTTGVANFLLSGLVAAATIFETLLLVAFSSVVVTLILEKMNILTTVVSAVQNTFWAEWGTVITLISLFVILFIFFKSGLKTAGTRFLWVAVAAALLGGSFTTNLLSDASTSVSEMRSGVATSAAAAISGQNCTNGSIPAELCISSSIVSGVIDPVFNYGAAGDMADKTPIWAIDDDKAFGESGPGGTVYYKADSNMERDGKNLKPVTLPPAGVVPTTHSTPTTAEYMRWTQTYTAAETKAIKEGHIKGCSTLTAPGLKDLEKKAGEELCYYKWQVRAALLYGMAGDSTVASYNAASGNQDFASRIQPALLALPSSGFALGAGGLLSGHNFFLMMEYVIQWIMVIFVLVIVMVKGNHKPIVDWAGGVLMNTIKVVLLGLMFGGVVVLWNWVGAILQEAFTSPASPVAFLFAGGSYLLVMSAMQGLLFGIGIVVIYALYFKALKKLGEGNPSLAQYNRNSFGAKVKGATTKTLAAGTAGAVTLGSGGTLAAAAFATAKTGSRVSADPDASIIRGITTGATQGHRSGGKSAAKKAAKISAQESMANADHKRDQALTSITTAQKQLTIADQHKQTAGQHYQQADQAEQSAELASQEAEALEHKGDTEMEAFYDTTTQAQPVQKEIAQTATVLRRASGKTASKQDDLDTYLTLKGVHTSHRLVTDPTTGKQATEVTDLSSGRITYEDAAHYNPGLELNAQLNTTEVAKFEDLTAKRDQAANLEDTARAEYEHAVRVREEQITDLRQSVLSMTHQEIEKTYGAGVGDPSQGQKLREWKDQQLKAQSLRAQATSYQTQAQQQRIKGKQSEETATYHANIAQKNIKTSYTYIRQADQAATPKTTAHRKLTSYQRGDYLREFNPQVQAMQTQALSLGANAKKAVIIEAPPAPAEASLPKGKVVNHQQQVFTTQTVQSTATGRGQKFWNPKP